MKKHHKDTRRSITENGITVTMLDDVNTKHNASRPPVYMSPRDVSQEGYVEGFYLPNRFRVESAGSVAEMEVQAFTQNGVKRFGCVSIELFPPKGSHEIVRTERIPVATWLRLAVKCSRQLCRYYPANYLGAMLDHNGKPITVVGELSGVRITKSFGTDEPAVIPLERLPSKGYQWSDDAARKLFGQQPRRRRNSMTLDRLQEVADFYNAATTYPLKAVMKSFGMARTTADKWVRKCKDLELITDETKQGANK
jgi:hypothetical protein